MPSRALAMTKIALPIVVSHAAQRSGVGGSTPLRYVLHYERKGYFRSSRHAPRGTLNNENTCARGALPHGGQV
jgi:hypothetical protein